MNGPVAIKTWDRNEVQVDAIKRASSKERLDEAQIQIDSHSDALSIRTRYPDRDHTNWTSGVHNNPASVEYNLTVPRNARLDKIDLINGDFKVEGVAGEVRASCRPSLCSFCPLACARTPAHLCLRKSLLR